MDSNLEAIRSNISPVSSRDEIISCFIGENGKPAIKHILMGYIQAVWPTFCNGLAAQEKANVLGVWESQLQGCSYTELKNTIDWKIQTVHQKWPPTSPAELLGWLEEYNQNFKKLPTMPPETVQAEVERIGKEYSPGGFMHGEKLDLNFELCGTCMWHGWDMKSSVKAVATALKQAYGKENKRH